MAASVRLFNPLFLSTQLGPQPPSSHFTVTSFPSISPPSLTIKFQNPLSLVKLNDSDTLLRKAKGINVEVYVPGDDDGASEVAIEQFRREVYRAGVIREIKRRRYHESSLEKRKRKSAEAARRYGNSGLRRMLARKQEEERKKMETEEEEKETDPDMYADLPVNMDDFAEDSWEEREL